MKYQVQIKYTNPAHEHVSLRRRVDTVTRLVEAKSEQEALNRAANQQRALGFMIKEASVVKSKVIKEEAEQIDAASNKYEVTKTKSRKMPMEFDSEAKMHHYDVHHNDKRVGTLTHDTYFGGTNGKLHGKDLPNIRNYGDNPHNQLHNFLKSKTGQKWAANLHKYQKEEVEQVTEAEREAGYKMSPAVRKAQAESDKLSKVEKPAQAGTLAAQRAIQRAMEREMKRMGEETVNTKITKAVNRVVEAAKNARGNKQLNPNKPATKINTKPEMDANIK
jgi:hypothetical protein